MRHGRFIAYTLIVTLMASVIAGALGVTLHFAKANVSENELVLREVINSGREHFTGNTLTQFESMVDIIEDNFDNANYLVCVACPTTTFDSDCFHITLWQAPSGRNLWYMNSSGYLSTYKSGDPYAYAEAIYRADFICNVTDNYFVGGVVSGGGLIQYDINNLPKFSLNGSGGLAAPCGAAFTSSSCGLWFNRDIRKLYDNYGILYNSNMILDIPMVEFDIKVFWLGERKYITTVNQSIVIQSDPDKMFYVFEMGDSIETGHERVLLSYNSSSNSRGLTLLPNGESFVSGLINVSPQGVYAWDISDIEWSSIYYFTLFEYPSTDVSGYAVNCPYYLNEEAPEPGSGGTPDSYTNSWSTFITYINNYDTTHVVPENLVDTIFGVNGFKLFPVDVSLPSSTIPSNNPVTTGIHTYKYHFSSLPSDIGLNYDLMDVCIIPKTFTGNYGLVFFYDDTLPAANKFVDYVDYKDLLEQFDLIIVIDDTLEALQENAWWEIFVPNDVWSHVDYMAVSGSSSLGIQYTSDPLPGNIESGFCIVTKRAIQRQQLYVFNDGIQKTYKLMSDYIDKRGDWEDSFLAWTASLFEQWQTLDGRLSNIYSLLYGLNLSDWMDDISSKLDRLISNTEETIDPDLHWFPSLWNWVLQFKPSNNDFLVTLDVYDDNWDRIPELPAPTSIPLLPTISGG